MTDRRSGGAARSVKRSVSFVVPRADEHWKVLAVRRPPDDEELPGLWGLPAGSLREDEDHEDAVRRAGREKLGVELGVGPVIGEGETEREGYLLRMRLYEAVIVRGEPEVPQPVQGVTQYTEWDWLPVGRLAEAARRGSLCTHLYLEELGELDEPGEPDEPSESVEPAESEEREAFRESQ